MKKHTPGPWSISLPRRDEKYGYTGHGIYAAGGKWIGDANGEPVRIPPDEVEGNALLMATAPELLEALSTLLADIEGLISESEGVAGLHLNGDLAPWDELIEGGTYERLTNLSAARTIIAKARGEA